MAAEHFGSPAAPVRASIGGYPIGTWLAGLRAQAEVPEGEKGALEPARRAALEAIAPGWAPTWPIAWQRTYAAARAWWLESNGRVDWAQLLAQTVLEGEQLGRRVAAQRAGFDGLVEERQEVLAVLGVERDPVLAAQAAARTWRAAKAWPQVSQADRFRPGRLRAGPVRRPGRAREAAM
ncbi:hypothetical protein [Kitasatospora sp. NRRL B-11411]|uniref:hypothetical protein n=1 Tax=Kitasatospora sp. NRRL B-11411 TaxID=1463822 RepID=UPI0004C3C78A|nr:hypothetical protein [Kitasatospora sp. NRRL B-11411]